MSRLVVGALVVSTTCCVSNALAQTPAPPPEGAQGSNQAAGLQKFDEGRALLEAGEYALALAAFDASNKLLASPNSLLYMARCYKAVGKIASAFTTYRLASRQAQDRLVATTDKRYAATRDAATREAAEIEPTVPKLAIRLPARDVPAGLVVRVNDVEAPPSTWGAAVDTDPGHVVVEASGPRLKPFRAELELRPSETERVDVLLERVPTAKIQLRFPDRPSGMSVRLDNRPLGERDAASVHELDPGAREVLVSAPGYKDFHWRGVLGDGDLAEVDVLLVRDKARDGGTPRWLFFTAGGASVVATGVGAWFGLRANTESQDERAKNQYAREPTKKDDIRTKSTVANVLFISGAVLGAGAVVLAFTTSWRRPPAKTDASVVIGLLGSRLAAEGRF